MINKNVYILYPAGYHGTYLKWAIESSDQDSRKTTVLNPINKSSSYKFGAVGTAHANIKIPTHQGFDAHQRWMILNRPSNFKVYTINTTTDSVIHDTANLLFEDATGIVILLHNNNDPAVDSYGKINCITKWPSYIDCVFKSGVFHNDPSITSYIDSLLDNNFDASCCSGNREFRNFLVVHNHVLGSQEKIKFEDLQCQVDIYHNWFKSRNFRQPHEVNHQTYIADVGDISDRVFQINCKSIADKDFLDIFVNLMFKTEISDEWDSTVLENIHQDYIDVQPNLQWFKSLDYWEKTGQLDNYLTSHAVIEAEIIRRIFEKSNIHSYTYSDRSKWLNFYADVCDPTWPPAPATEEGLYNLPKHIQDEIKNKFNYQPIVNGPPISAILHLDWKNKSLVEINQVFQWSRS